jgi:hypothetical protein
MHASISLPDTNERSKTPKKEFPVINPNLIYSHSARKSRLSLSEWTKDTEEFDQRRNQASVSELEDFVDPIRMLHEKLQTDMSSGKFDATKLESLHYHLKLIREYVVQKRVSEKRLDQLLSQQFNPEIHMFIKVAIFGFRDQNPADKSAEHLTKSYNTPSQKSGIKPFVCSPDSGFDVNVLYNNIELLRQKLFEMKSAMAGFEGSMTEITAEDVEMISTMNQCIEALSKRADNLEQFYHESSSHHSLMSQRIDQLAKEVAYYKKKTETQKQDLDSIKTQIG